MVGGFIHAPATWPEPTAAHLAAARQSQYALRMIQLSSQSSLTDRRAHRWRSALVLALVVSAASACSGSSAPATGSSGAHCYPNSTCNRGLACVRGVCRAQSFADAGAARDLGAPDRGAAADQGATGCPCTAKAGTQRCAGNRVQSCSGGYWRTISSCTGSAGCVKGACVTKATSCPTKATYSGGTVLVERYAPVAVSGCIPAGSASRTVYYSESKPETRQRSLALKMVSCSNWLDVTIDWKKAFGIDPRASVSSSSSTSSLSVKVPANQYAQVYRQTSKVYREATLWTDNKFAGVATVTDWIWTPEIAVGSSCPVKSKLTATTNKQPSCLTWWDGCSCP